MSNTDAAPVVPPVPPRVARRWTRRHFVLLWVFLGAGASFSFTVLTITVLLAGFYAHWISEWATDIVAYTVWPFVCLIEIIFQVIPMNVRQQTQGWHVVADQWTSYLPITGCVVIGCAMFFGGFSMSGSGWIIWWQSLLTGIVEFMLLAVSNKLIAAARGSEETPV